MVMLSKVYGGFHIFPRTVTAKCLQTGHNFVLSNRFTFAERYFSLLSFHSCRLEGPGIESRWGQIFCTRPYRCCGPPSLLCNRYLVSFLGVKRPGRGVNHPTSYSAEVKETVQLYLYSPFVLILCFRVSLTVLSNDFYNTRLSKKQSTSRTHQKMCKNWAVTF